MSLHAETFTLVYAPEAPYPRIIADTGRLAPEAVRIVEPFHVEGGTMTPCCVLDGNLERKDSPRPDVKMMVCRRCGRRHFTAIAEAGRMGVTRG